MAFMCKNCVPSHAEWLFDLMMGVSHGACEDCGTVGPCIDWHGNSRSDDDKPKGEPLDTSRYDGCGTKEF